MGDEDSAYYLLESRLRDPSADPTDLPLSLFKSITNNFSDKEVIGSGGFGVVYKGVLPSGIFVAVKKLSDALVEDKLFQDEVACLIRAKHRNIVRLLGYCADTQGKITEYKGELIMAKVRARLLCFEYVSGGSLDMHLEDEFCGLEWHQRYIIIKGICHGLRHLHEEQKIIHMDLKPQNILMDPNMVPKITDFGLSRLIGIQQSRIITMNNFGTLGYMAPEYSHHGTIKFKSDIYSLGVILLELITGTRMPPNIENVHKNWKNRLQETLSYSSVEASYKQVKRCVQVALNCMETDSEKRPSIGEIVKILNEIETGYEEDETPTSTQLLCIHPLELRFPFKPNHSITCPLHLTNNTDHRVAFRLQPERLERYFTEWLCGVAPPRSTYTLIVTMRDRQQSLPATDEFLIEQSRLRGETELKDISQGKAETEYDNFFTEVKEKGVDPVLEQTLTAVCDPEGNITAEIISTVDFDKMVSMDVHPTKPWIITSHFNGHICIWNYQTKEMVNSFEVTKEQEVLTAKFIAQKEWIVAGGGDGRIYVYSYNTMKKVKVFKALSEQITSLAIHPTKPYVLSASYDFVIKLWDWENGWKCTRIFNEEHSSSVMQLVFNPMDPNAFASVSMDKTIKIWSVDSPHSNLTLDGHSSNVRCLDYFTHGGKQYLFTGSDDGTAKIWDVQKKICVKTLVGHANRVSTVYAHPQLPILMTGSRDGTVRLWNTSTFRLERILNFGLRKVHALGCMKGSRR